MEWKTIYFVLVAFKDSLLASSHVLMIPNSLFMATGRSSLFPVMGSKTQRVLISVVSSA